MAELQAKQGDASNNQQAEAKQRETDTRNSILAQVLDQSARARLSNLALVKPEKAKEVENYLIHMAGFGKLGGKISESGLIEILEKVSQQTQKKTTVTFNRRRVMDSDDEDD
ncbi:programmed cell death protein 5 [Chaetodon auriga]|uniref:programmed cell death protein 5 n=1 Tax=Chaetodon auriga TaxID=39042 RepID=UPI004032A902